MSHLHQPIQILLCTAIASFALADYRLAAQPWKPVEGQLLTPWAEQVSPQSPAGSPPWNEYPRPQLQRENWVNLNGLWEYAIVPATVNAPEKYDGQILVPYPIESALSGVKKQVGPDNALWYRRTFTLPALQEGQRLLLNFGAVDWECTVWVNETKLGTHKGGYDPFQFDITAALKPDQEQQVIVVRVWDPTDQGFQPRGKQVREPGGIWYTPVTGIWQTVWLEAVPEVYIRSLRIVPDVDNERAFVTVNVNGSDNATVSVRVAALSRGEENLPLTLPEHRGNAGSEIAVPILKPYKWTPESPWLYHLEITASSGSGKIDTVRSYLGMRKVGLIKDQDGFLRLGLNDEVLFHLGPLDQGWWPDGLYTAPTDAALRYDIEVTKQLGFNMCRKHVKVEPARWYYWCDRLGLMVWQDMPNGDRHIKPDEPDIERTPESADNFKREWKAIVDANYNHPSIVVWVPFNEGWGQFQTNEILAWTKEYDPTRLVDGPSGWTDRQSGDLHDMHRYPGPAMPAPESNRAVVLGEFGGLGWPVDGHLWWDKRNWGYRTYKSQQELQTQYELLIRRLRPLIYQGLAAAVYTQTTDVEGEVNGLMTYDRKVLKLDADRVRRLHERLYRPAPKQTVVIPTSQENPQTWRYTFTAPADDWMTASFDDSSWKEGSGGFGTPDTPGTVVRTRWDTKEIWLRRRVQLDPEKLHTIGLQVHHDEDTKVYLNGRLIAELAGYTTEYQSLELDEAVRSAVVAGENILAVHCKQTGGGQYIDLGILDFEEQ